MRRNVSAGPFVVPVFMIVFGVVYAYANRTVPVSDMRLVTPVTIALVVVSLVIVARTFITGPDEREPYTGPAMRRPVLLVLSTIILLAGALYDFPIAAGLFLAVAMLALGVRRPDVILPVAILTPLLLFAAFVWVGVPLTSFWLEI